MGKGRTFGGGCQLQRGFADFLRGDLCFPADAGSQPPVVSPAFLIHLGVDFILAEQPVQITPFLQKTVPWGLFHCVKGCNGIAAPTGRIDLPLILLLRRRFRRTLLPAQLVFQPKQLLIIISLPPAGDQSFQKTVVLTVTPKQRHGATFPALFQQAAQTVGLTARRLFLNAGIGQLVQQKQKRQAKRLRKNGQFLLAEGLNLLPRSQRVRQGGKPQFPSCIGQKFPGKTGNPAFSVREGRKPNAL